MSDLKHLQVEAVAVSKLNRASGISKGFKDWEASDYCLGFMADVGALSKLIMMKENLRDGSDVDSKLAHELSDCLWSVLVLADKLGIDLESEFLHSIEELRKRVTKGTE